MNNWVVKLYPSTKFLFLLILIILSIFVPGYKFQYLVLLFILIVSLLSNSLKGFLSVFFKSIFIIVLFLFIIQTYIVPNSDSIQLVGFIHFSSTGLNDSLNMTSKIIAISSSIIWFFQVTSIKDIIFALERIGAPRKVTFIIASTIQLVPQMTSLSKTITDAQKSRGIETEGDILIRAKAFIPMIGPLVLSSIQQTEERVLALESRAFSSNVRKTSIYTIKKSKLDYILDILLFAVFIGYFVRRFI
ncbi:energy-coupling factor transporter transmembrane component T [uncultured Clostridium sp.]|uniref:energy-coupling factor transporter transmembrane component T n=1 Tax=uncultured Clostridium sp. TaxID=59620 RepID=UPI0028EE8D08|nr:energy-coupling factor transporter transmembrane component T [uncultured Clostridium sp.]